MRSLDEIHAEMKRGAPGKAVFYWHIVMTRPLDEVPAGKTAWETDVLPYHFADIVKPGLCDGLFAYPNGAKLWEMYQRPCKANRWPFFSHLSHPSFMRLGEWQWTVDAVKTPAPGNLGYFLYCEGTCAARNMWNDDPNVPKEPAWNQPRLSSVLHARRFAARENVGMDVIRRHVGLTAQLDFDLENAKPRDVRHLCALVRNHKDPTYFTDPAEAIARDVKVRLRLPAGLVNDGNHSAAAEVSLGDLPPGASRTVDWWVTIADPAAVQEKRPYSVSASSRDTAGARAEAGGSAEIAHGQPHEVRRAGETWLEPGYRLAGDRRARVTLEGMAGPVAGVSLSAGADTLVYRGEIAAGTRVVIAPDGKARLFGGSLLEATQPHFVDATDASGHHAHDAGYQVGGLPVRLPIQGGRKYRVSIAGKADGGANSLVVLRYRLADGKTEDQSVLANRFDGQWREASEELAAPTGAVRLELVVFYRFHQKGRIWYGKVGLARSGMPADGEDVSAQVQGLPPMLGAGTVTAITYGNTAGAPETEPVRVHLGMAD